MLSFLWAAASLFVVTAFPATAALTAGMSRAEDGYAAAFGQFARVFRRGFLPGLAIGLSLLACLAFTWMDLQALARWGHFIIAACYAGLLVLLDIFAAGCAVSGAAFLAISTTARTEHTARTAREMVRHMLRNWLLRPWLTLRAIFLCGVCAWATAPATPAPWFALMVLVDGMVIGWAVGPLGEAVG